jgi:mRNA interferase RelE/StbE
MAYKLLYHPDIAKEDLGGIPQNIKSIIRKAIEERLATAPLEFGEPLRQSLKGHRKLRVGDYRVIYRVESDTVVILKIGHRRDVYCKVFSRLSS